MSFGTAHLAAVCIGIIDLGISYGISFAGMPSEVNRLSDSQRRSVLVRMNLVVQTGVQRLVFVDTIIGHLNPFS